MQLEPFDYDKYTQGRIVVTRDGQPVTSLVKFNRDVEFPIYGLIEDRGGVHKWTVDGSWEMIENNNDLFILPEGIFKFSEMDEKRINAIDFLRFVKFTGFKHCALGWFDPKGPDNQYFTDNNMYDRFDAVILSQNK